MTPTIINFKPLGDERGSLIAIEAEKSVPFPVRRVYYIFGTKDGVERGFHAHKALNQVAVAVTGSCEMILDNGESRNVVLLDSAEKGVLIGPGIWHEMRQFSSDCVLLVLADQHYDEADYIRNYDEFKKWIKND
ncbi:MAG: FdtA/QdtA family cupin domain-containing protein [Opitutales bacterium]|jgi:dTDP-4-dehydrorhamnose 3,5-epimerase-like enzyme|nr:FdtA/QdtA family cupin domain-containing protein [Opitutales bacterium]